MSTKEGKYEPERTAMWWLHATNMVSNSHCSFIFCALRNTWIYSASYLLWLVYSLSGCHRCSFDLTSSNWITIIWATAVHCSLVTRITRRVLHLVISTTEQVRNVKFLERYSKFLALFIKTVWQGCLDYLGCHTFQLVTSGTAATGRALLSSND